jgi:hypothetical protein
MNARDLLAVPTTAILALTSYLRETSKGKDMDAGDAAALAIDAWLAVQKANEPPAGCEGLRGYQWKCLFLPDSTELRMCCAERCHYASVVGDAIIYQGCKVSPRQLTIAIAGEGRNAWRDLSIRLPGQSKWKPACVLRREARAPQPAPMSPAEALNAAAAAMSEALKCALALAEHANALSVRKVERRVERHRRTEDLAVDAWKAD